MVLDTIESLFSGFANTNILRAELRRLFGWLKEKGVTALITAESGDGKLTRQGIEEFVADCVLLLDHRVQEQLSVRRMRVTKYRGSMHGTSEYPFLIGENGISVLPLSALKLEHRAPTQKISSGVPRLDAMLGGKGFYRGMSILVSGGAGTGKSSLAAQFVEAACRRGERALYMASEQSIDEVVVTVRDNGCGMSEPVQARVFERLYQEGRSKDHGHGGLGLGLAICKELVWLHSGKIWVESRPGKGSAFSFTLPIYRAGEEGQVPTGNGRGAGNCGGQDQRRCLAGHARRSG